MIPYNWAQKRAILHDGAAMVALEAMFTLDGGGGDTLWAPQAHRSQGQARQQDGWLH